MSIIHITKHDIVVYICDIDYLFNNIYDIVRMYVCISGSRDMRTYAERPALIIEKSRY